MAPALDDHAYSPVRRGLAGVALAILLLLASFLLTDLGSRFPIGASHWNWVGKSASILFSCALLTFSPWLRSNVGLRWRQSPGSPRLSVSCFIVFTACAIGIGFLIPPVGFSADTLLYQFLMPAIDEELMMRGILLAMLERSFGQSPMSCRLRFGLAGLFTSLAFGLGHAISIEDGRIHFAALMFSITATWAAIAALVRTRSGSLLWPMILHSVWDGSIFLVAMLR